MIHSARSAGRWPIVLALRFFTIGRKNVTRFVADNRTTAKTVLDAEQFIYAYCDLESGTNALHVYFGVAEVGRATAILEQAAAAAAKP